MKLLIKYTGKRYRVTIDINQNCLIKDLKKEIEIKCRLTCIGFRLLYTIIPNYKVLLTDSFPLSFFNITQGSIIEVEAYGYTKLLSHKRCRNTTYIVQIGGHVKYFIPEITVFDVLIEMCKKGEYSSFVNTAESFMTGHPEEDILNHSYPSF